MTQHSLMSDRANPDWVWHPDLSLYLDNSFFKNWTKQQQQISCTFSVLFSSTICPWFVLWYLFSSFLLAPWPSLFSYLLKILRLLSPQISWNSDANFSFLLKLTLNVHRTFHLVYQNGSPSVIFQGVLAGCVSTFPSNLLWPFHDTLYKLEQEFLPLGQWFSNCDPSASRFNSTWILLEMPTLCFSC